MYLSRQVIKDTKFDVLCNTVWALLDSDPGIDIIEIRGLHWEQDTLDEPSEQG